MGGISSEAAAVAAAEAAAVGSAHSQAPTGCHLEVFGCDSVSLEAEGKQGASDAARRPGAPRRADVSGTHVPSEPLTQHF